MATEKWAATSDRGTVLTTQLNALANGSFSALGTVIDNATNLDRYAVALLDVTFASAPTERAPLILYAVPAMDGSNYAYATLPSQQMQVGEFQVDDVTTQQLIVTAPFLLPSGNLLKFVLENRAGFAMPATGSTVRLYTFNRAVN